MRGSLARLVIASAVAPFACGCHSHDSGSAGAPSASVATTSGVAALPASGAGAPSTVAIAPMPSATEPPLLAEARPEARTAKIARCGWGALTATSTAKEFPWAIALVDVELPLDTRGLHVTALELANEHGVAAKMGDRATLRVQEGALSYSFAAAGTRELGVLPAGAFRLRAAAVLDHPDKRVAGAKPTTCSVALSDDTGATLVAAGPVDPEWKNE